MRLPFRPIALALACAVTLLPQASIGQTPIVLRAACPPVDNCTPMLYAIHAGLFRRVGLDVQLSAMASGAVITAAVAGGSLDVGMSSMMALVTAHARGVPISLIAPASIYETDKPPELLLVKKDSPIADARDLRGKTFGTSSLRDILAVATFAWIDQNGGDSTAVKTIEVPLSALLPALASGRIDATTIQEPRLSEALQSGTVRVLGKPFDAIAKHFLVTAWFTTSGFATANPTVIERFARVMSDASAYANTHPSETAPLLADHSKVDLATIQHSDRETYDQVLKASELQRVIDVAAQYHLIDRSFDANDFINPLVRSPKS